MHQQGFQPKFLQQRLQAVQAKLAEGGAGALLVLGAEQTAVQRHAQAGLMARLCLLALAALPGGGHGEKLFLGLQALSRLALFAAFWYLSFSLSGSAAGAVLACLLATLCYGVSASFTKRYMAGLPSLVSATGSQLGAALALASGRLADRWTEGLANSATIRISAPADQMDRQTQAVLDLLATALGVATSRLRLLRGATGRDKQVQLVAP